jgi:hypothetical protein
MFTQADCAQPGTLRELVEVAQTKRELIERAWHDYFG